MVRRFIGLPLPIGRDPTSSPNLLTGTGGKKKTKFKERVQSGLVAASSIPDIAMLADDTPMNFSRGLSGDSGGKTATLNPKTATLNAKTPEASRRAANMNVPQSTATVKSMTMTEPTPAPPQHSEPAPQPLFTSTLKRPAILDEKPELPKPVSQEEDTKFAATMQRSRRLIGSRKQREPAVKKIANSKIVPAKEAIFSSVVHDKMSTTQKQEAFERLVMGYLEVDMETEIPKISYGLEERDEEQNELDEQSSGGCCVIA
jgi:hypothetical protein